MHSCVRQISSCFLVDSAMTNPINRSNDNITKKISATSNARDRNLFVNVAAPSAPGSFISALKFIGSFTSTLFIPDLLMCRSTSYGLSETSIIDSPFLASKLMDPVAGEKAVFRVPLLFTRYLAPLLLSFAHFSGIAHMKSSRWVNWVAHLHPSRASSLENVLKETNRYMPSSSAFRTKL